ncbi:MAG TPA: NAD kinase [Cryomorphaceae bacterium]|jgi:NAD+ kinase|nr:NAD kinase [Schleiferiaceae bacterium]MDG2109615.1 NAD kinase [Schleiferiaceae bacterium]HBK20628.1 NAD kinase [Cryomorphaceae bacterium]|tara:strand:+ start:1603 stop:2493 length:891 start_codon:yes stop_codon:yes gene_type:complete
MRIALFGRTPKATNLPYLELVLEKLVEEGVDFAVYHTMVGACDEIKAEEFPEMHFSTFADEEELENFDPHFLISLGGDGTILDATVLIQNKDIPILGINMGRLGFLANVAKSNIETSLDALFSGRFQLDFRSLLQIRTSCNRVVKPNFALNEITIARKETTSMITVHTYLNGAYLNSYWADGLIVSTPTGSTGYSLSCGGPIIMPNSENFVLTPIAPHNLTMRPFVISDNNTLRLRIESRENEFLTSLDSRIHSFDATTELFIQKADFRIALVQTELQDFPSTLRNKLSWGLDYRN